MKIPLAAVTFAITGLSAAPVNVPAQNFEPTAVGRQVIVVPAQDLNPHFVLSQPVPYGSVREASAAQFGTRLGQLDDRLRHLGAVGSDLEAVEALRANVASALLDLRDPTIGINAAQTAVTNAINALEIAIDSLGQPLNPPVS